MPIGFMPPPIDILAEERKQRIEEARVREGLALLLNDPQEWARRYEQAQREKAEALTVVMGVLARNAMLRSLR